MIKVTSHLSYLAHRVINESSSFAPVMEGQAYNEEGRAINVNLDHDFFFFLEFAICLYIGNIVDL